MVDPVDPRKPGTDHDSGASPPTTHAKPKTKGQTMINQMTDSDLTTAAASYREINLEGGDGYNPYQVELEARAAAAAKARPRTSTDVLLELERLDCSIARESGTYDAERIETLRAELADLEAAADADFAAEWSLRVTVMRRVAWNEGVRAGTITNDNMGAAIKANGWSPSDLSRAINLHRLPPPGRRGVRHEGR